MYQKSADEFYLTLESVLDKHQAAEEDLHCLCEVISGQGPVKVHSFMDQDVLDFCTHAQSKHFIRQLLQCTLCMCDPFLMRSSCAPAHLHLCSAVQSSNSVSAAPTIVAYEILSWLQFQVHLGIKARLF